MILIPPPPPSEKKAWHLITEGAANAERPGRKGMNAISCDHGDLEWLLVRACVHEAAHAVVAQRFGFKTRIALDRETIGTGKCWIYGLNQAPRALSRSVGAAGLIGNSLAEQGFDAVTVQSLLNELSSPGSLSPQDVALMDGCINHGEAARCADLVRSSWGDVIVMACEHLAAELQFHLQSNQPAPTLSAAARVPVPSLLYY